MTVQEIMTSSPQCCTPESTLQEVANMMKDCDCGAIPVVENMDSKRPVGVITDRDIVIRVVAAGGDCRQGQVDTAMTRSTVTIREDQNLREAESAMKERQVRRIIVVDEDNRCVGILAQADIARHRSERETGDVVEEISEPSMA